MSDNSKFLSHRLRGFDTREHTLRGLRRAVESDIPCLEIDVRVSADGAVYVHHDDHITAGGRFISVSKNSSKDIDSFIHSNALDMMTLDTLLDVFAERKNPAQFLMIDIKDFGYEKLLADIVEKHGLTENVRWVSWIPQTLLEQDRISPESVKMQSYQPVSGLTAYLMKDVSAAQLPFSNSVLIGKNRYDRPLKEKRSGFHHSLKADVLPEGLLRVLRKNGGGVCLPKKLATKEMIRRHKDSGLLVSVFSAADRTDYENLAVSEIDIVFCDFAD